MRKLLTKAFIALFSLITLFMAALPFTTAEAAVGSGMADIPLGSAVHNGYDHYTGYYTVPYLPGQYFTGPNDPRFKAAQKRYYAEHRPAPTVKKKTTVKKTYHYTSKYHYKATGSSSKKTYFKSKASKAKFDRWYWYTYR